MGNIALGSIFIECNHFGGQPADMETFRRGGLFYGDELLALKTGTIGGMLGELRTANSDVRPLLAASACPSGPVTTDCWRELKTDLLNRLQESGPLDGLLLALHGAAAADGAGDLEGDLLESVRSVVGDTVPVVVTLDLHAHVTQRMIDHADALLAWETYPHADAFTTGERGARTLQAILDGKLRPRMVMAKVPVLVGAIHGHTQPPGPFADVMTHGKACEGRDGIWSVSCFLVHPYLDLPGMGGGALVVSHDDIGGARELARDLAGMYWDRRHDLEPTLLNPSEAVARGLEIEGGPVVLVETADCCGGGAAGDSVHTLRVLINHDAESIVPVVDPEAVEICRQGGEGAEVQLSLGHNVDSRWGEPLPVKGRVVRLLDGNFRYEGGIWDGQPGDMGPTAVVRVGSVNILITTHATYDWGTEQLDAAGLDARSAKFVVAKNPMNHRRAFADCIRAAFVLDTPGPTPATVRHLPFQQMNRPWFPLDTDCPQNIVELMSAF